MESLDQSRPFSWFDELPAVQAVDFAKQSSPGMFALQHVMLSRAIITIPPPPPKQRASVWALALAAIAGASTFVVGVALATLL